MFLPKEMGWRFVLTVVVMLSLRVSSSPAFPCLVTSTFDTDDEGWVVCDWWVEGNPPTLGDWYVPEWGTFCGENPHICHTDQTTGGFYFSAPSKFLGDKSCAYGANLCFDLSETDSCGDASDALVLVGAGMTLYRRNAPCPAICPLWSSYCIELVPGPDWHLNNLDGRPLDQPGDEIIMQEVLGSLDALYIQGDWSGALDNRCCLDNVVLTPEPATLSLLALGVLALLRRRR